MKKILVCLGKYRWFYGVVMEGVLLRCVGFRSCKGIGTFFCGDKELLKGFKKRNDMIRFVFLIVNLEGR